jgi:uncharacterized RDD family membrane protein YckC
MSELPAGWYPDPADPATQRYWDGEGWLGEAIPVDATPPDGPPPAAISPAASPAAAPTTGPPSPWTQPPGGPTTAAPATPTGAPPTDWTPPPGWMPPPGWAPPPAYAYRPELRPHGRALAGFGPRLVARLLDVIAVLLINVVVNGWLVYQWWQEFAPYYRAAMAEPFGEHQPSARLDVLMWIIPLIATLVWLAYEAPAIGNTGQTPGKRIMHIQVVRLDSTEAIGFGRAVLRWSLLGVWTTLWTCVGVGLLLQLIDAVSPVFDQRLRQALHDKAARTVVVEAPRGQRLTTRDSSGAADDPTGGAR